MNTGTHPSRVGLTNTFYCSNQWEGPLHLKGASLNDLLGKKHMMSWIIFRLRLPDHVGTLVSSVADPDPVPFYPLDPGSGIGKNQDRGSGMNIPDYISESLETIF